MFEQKHDGATFYIDKEKKEKEQKKFKQKVSLKSSKYIAF